MSQTYAQRAIVYGVITASDSILPFVNVALFNLNDSAMVAGTVSDLSGSYSLSAERGEYILKASHIGYKSYMANFVLTNIDTNINIPMEINSELLDDVMIAETRTSLHLNKSVYTFTEEQKKTAVEARNLAGNLSGLHINAVDNKLSTIDGKPILILINGVKATDTELKLIKAKNVINIEYYQVPPLRYAEDAEVVVNIKANPGENGISGDVFARVGQMYSQLQGNAAIVRGRDKFTIGVGTHINHKRDVRDEERGIYSYAIGKNKITYDYFEKGIEWGSQNSATAIWLNQSPDNYTLQMRTDLEKTDTKAEKTNSINLTNCNQQSKRIGSQTDTIKSLITSADVYFSKKFGNHTIATDIFYTYTHDSQKTNTNEMNLSDSAFVYNDNLDLSVSKNTLINELYYAYDMENLRIELGYKGQFSALDNNVKNSMSVGTDIINIQKHYMYAEVSADKTPISYDIGLGVTYNNRENVFANWAFTPMVSLGYSIDRKNMMILNLNSETTLPTIQQMSRNKILVMQDFYSSGNQNIENSTDYNATFQYSFQPNSKLKLLFDLNYSYSHNHLFDKYFEYNNAINMMTTNAHCYSEAGPNLSITYNPIESLRVSVQSRAIYQMFIEETGGPITDNWYLPIIIHLSYSKSNVSCAYLQMFGNKTLNGLNKSGLEKVSYININYQWHNLEFGAQCIFPFIADEFKNETTDKSLVYNMSKSNLKTKNRSFSVTLTWNFAKGKIFDSAKMLENIDDDDVRFRY